MAQILVDNTQAVVGNSPMSGSESPSFMGGDKITRTQAKKIFKDEVDLIVQAIKAIPTIFDALSQVKKGVPMNVSFTDDQGQMRQYTIGRSELRQFISQLVKRVQKLVALAFTLNKTRRRTGPNSGFLAPQRYNQEIVNFFTQADLGPRVTGEFVLKTDKAMNKKAVPESTSLAEQRGTRLNDSLFFIQPQVNGQQNPLYGVISQGTLMPLFALHAYYTPNPIDPSRRGLRAIARDPNSGQQLRDEATGQPVIDATRLIASNQMREHLGGVMAQTIANDARVIGARFPELAEEAQQKAQQLTDSIQNPRAVIDSRVGLNTPNVTEMFNPNYFIYAHFSKLNTNAKLAADEDGLTADSLAALRPQILSVYGPILQQALQSWQDRASRASSPDARDIAQLRVQLLQQAMQTVPEQGVLTYQQDDVARARALKNQMQGAENRRRNAEKKRAEAAQAALAAQQPAIGGLPGGIPGVVPTATISNLPGATISGQSNIYNGSSSGSRSGSRV